MSASNYTWVCFDCRTSVRYPKTSNFKPKCQKCNDDMFCLGYKVEIPIKNNLNAWKKLRTDSRNFFFNDIEKARKNNTELKHYLEKEINRLEKLDKNKERQKYINDLKRRLEELS